MKTILLLFICFTASADEIVAIDKVENTVELASGKVIEVDDVTDVKVGDEADVVVCDEDNCKDEE